MKILMIFDNDVDLAAVNTTDTTIHLFPFTSNFITIDKLQNKLRGETLDSAALINAEVEFMQQSIHDWSHALGNHPIHHKSLKNWFRLPDNGGSAWWFGMLAEKNSVQDNAFFKIAQINALATLFKTAAYDTCWIALKDKRQAKIIRKIARQHSCQTRLLTTINSQQQSRKHKLMEFINHLGILGALLMSNIYWLIWLKDSRTARKNLPSQAARLQQKHDFLFVSYFPNLDEEAAKAGSFRNKYALPLQDKLAELNLPITWLLMPVYYNGHDFASSMRLAKNFSQQGEKLFVLQEFFTLRLFFKAAWWWLKQSLLSGYLLLFMDKKILTGKLAHPACLPILKYLWWQSFVGASGTRGILFYLTYKEMFHKIKKIKACLYFCEMQAWEKAFLMAKNQEQPTAKTLSFQHTVVMKNYFNYFYSPAEVMQTGDVLDFPLPDQLIANGKQMRALLAESFPNLWEAEAIRQLYISKLTQDSTVHAPPVPPVLLVVGSYDRVETKSLLTLVYKAFPQAIDFRIGFKGSPVNPVENLFNELGIDWRAANYTIEFTEIAKLLPTVSIALVANTTVAIEALAFKRPLIIPLLADTMLMNPVINTDAEFHLISTPEQLRMRVNDLMATDIAPATTHDNAFINSYWHLDLTIPKWTQLLTNALCD